MRGVSRRLLLDLQVPHLEEGHRKARIPRQHSRTGGAALELRVGAATPAVVEADFGGGARACIRDTLNMGIENVMLTGPICSRRVGRKKIDQEALFAREA